jgi:hypothetical protein
MNSLLPEHSDVLYTKRPSSVEFHVFKSQVNDLPATKPENKEEKWKRALFFTLPAGIQTADPQDQKPARNHCAMPAPSILF